MNPAVAIFGAVTLGYLVIALATTWHQTFGPLFENLAANIENFKISVPIPRVPDIHFGFLADAVRFISRETQRGLSELAGAVAYPLVALYQLIGNLVNRTTTEIADLAQDTAHTIGQIRSVIIPRAIAAHVGWIPRHFVALERQIAALPHTVPKFVVHTVPAVVKPPLVKVLHEAVAIPWPRIGRLEREGATLGHRIDKLARRVTPTALVAATVLALSKVGAQWTRCSRSKKWGKTVCGMDDSLLESLIADTLLVVGTISLVEFAEGLQAGLGEVTPQIQHFWRAG